MAKAAPAHVVAAVESGSGRVAAALSTAAAELAAQAVRAAAAAGALAAEARLALYALEQQARRGGGAAARGPAPSAFSAAALARWRAWEAVAALPRPDARQRYIATAEAELGRGMRWPEAEPAVLARLRERFEAMRQ